MEVRDAMTTPVTSVASTATIAEAARVMAERDIGVIPVLEGEALLGIVTDRDIVTRSTAAGLDPILPVVRAMTYDVATCRETDEIDDVLEAMVTHGVRRMPICSREGRLVGIVSLSDLACLDWDKERIGMTFADTCGARSLQKRKVK